MDVDLPVVLQRCQDDGVDAAVLVPNCPVCHQTLSLTRARWRPSVCPP